MTSSYPLLNKVQVLSGVRVRMRDGVELNVRITRPDAPGRFPAILQYNPYRRLGVPSANYRDAHPPVVPFLAERGYVLVQCDVRGTGSSSGHCSDMYSDDEREDGLEMIDWCSRQDWSTGAVGMIGKSYEAVVQWQMAAQNPLALKAIVVRSGGVALANEFSNPGGSIRPWMFEAYAPWMTAFNFAPPDPTLTGVRWADIWKERLENSTPWGISFISNLSDGDYWRRRSVAPDFDRVKCAVLLIEGWADWYSSAQLHAFQRLAAPRKVLIGPWGHFYADERDCYPGPRIDARIEYLKWFDHHLKGIENGVMDEPPVTVFVREWQNPELICPEEPGRWLSSSEWPPRGTDARTWNLSEKEAVASSPIDGRDSFEFRPSVGMAMGRLGLGTTQPWGMPTDQRVDDAYSLVYDAPPVDADTTIIGEPEAVLFVSTTASTTYIGVRLCDVAPDGTSRLVSYGGLMTTLRHDPLRNDPMVPGEAAEIRFPMKHCAYTLKRGHRMRIAVSGSLFQNAWPAGQTGITTIHRGTATPSRIIVPTMSGAVDQLPEPIFTPSPFPQTLPSAFPKPTYSIIHDYVDDTVTCELAMQIGDAGARGDGVNRSKFTVSNKSPANAVIRSSFHYRPAHPTLAIELETHCQTLSNADTYTHAVQLEVRIDGARHFSRSWTKSVPRLGS